MSLLPNLTALEYLNDARAFAAYHSKTQAAPLEKLPTTYDELFAGIENKKARIYTVTRYCPFLAQLNGKDRVTSPLQTSSIQMGLVPDPHVKTSLSRLKVLMTHLTVVLFSYLHPKSEVRKSAEKINRIFSIFNEYAGKVRSDRIHAELIEATASLIGKDSFKNLPVVLDSCVATHSQCEYYPADDVRILPADQAHREAFCRDVFLPLAKHIIASQQLYAEIQATYKNYGLNLFINGLKPIIDKADNFHATFKECFEVAENVCGNKLDIDLGYKFLGPERDLFIILDTKKILSRRSPEYIKLFGCESV